MSAANGGIKPKNKARKRLVILCDGTWENSTDTSLQPPTNITRLSRALSHYAAVGDEEIEQVIFYQSGVGTEPGSVMSGGLRGVGVSSNVRAAYGFLAHNYDKGDQIYFFGFSRGAYTARAIAGLVTSLGLLTKRGMDRFPEVYKNYYGHIASRDTDKEVVSPELLKELVANEEVDLSARDAVQIVGVFDTVAYHAEGTDGEEPEFNNTRLSPSVKYAYHALALDEERYTFQPTLWRKPSKTDLATGAHYRHEELRQVWFSGVHSDIGGGLSDPRLSDITLAWMISRCSGDDKLAFMDLDNNPESWYLLDKNITKSATVWATKKGPNTQPKGGIEAQAVHFIENLRSGPRPLPMTEPDTNEEIHRSIQGRNMTGTDSDGVYWPCKLLKGTGSVGKWAIAPNSTNILSEEAPDKEADAIEDLFHGRIRKLPLIPVPVSKV